MLIISEHIDYRTVPNDSLVLCTTNAVITRNGLVMGAGNALSMKTAHPSIPKRFAALIEDDPYGVIIDEEKGGFLGGFQTKHHWKSYSTIELLKFSTDKLLEIADQFETIHLPYPCVNNGNLDKYEVLDVIHILPDNVLVYYKG